MDPINTQPIQQFIASVKSADAKNAREIKLDIQTSKRLAFALGEVMARLNGDLEKLLQQKQNQDETVVVQLGSTTSDWK
jgi:hypothetical protein